MPRCRRGSSIASIPRDLETIVLKALAKDPNDRFGSAEEMADELRRFVENRPIHSRPIPAYQQFWRWCKRNPGLAGANIAAAVLTTVLAIVSTVAAWTYRDQRTDRPRRQRRPDARPTQGRSSRPCTTGPAPAGSATAPVSGSTAWTPWNRRRNRPGAESASRAFDPLRDEAIACLALPDLKPTGRVIHRPPGVIAVAFDPTMTRYAPAVPRWDDLGPPRRRRPGGRPLPRPAAIATSASSASAPTAATWRPRISRLMP